MIDRIFQLAMIVAYRLAKVYWFLRRPSTQGAHVALWHDDRLLVIRNSYKSELSLVCGGIKTGEDPLVAAIREVTEEIGVKLATAQLTFVGEFFSDKEFKKDRCMLYEVQLDGSPDITLDNREVVESFFLSRTELASRPQVDLLKQYLEATADRS